MKPLLTWFDRVILFTVSVLLTIAIVIAVSQLGHSQTFPKHWGHLPKPHKAVTHKHAPKITHKTWKMPK